MAEFSRDQVEHLAKLSRLALSDEEIDAFASQIDEMISTVSAVQNVDTTGVEPMSHPHSIPAAMREDVVVATLNQDKALDQAPDSEDGRFKVPQILGEDSN